jgi:pimeloyl-ACP methyl ester carboxylesterase
MPFARGWRVAAATTLVAVLATAGGAGVGVGAARTGTDAPKIEWRSCDGGECAELAVPLDYENPRDGRTIDVALFRARALDRERRIGSLFVNPGGPGASGVAFARDLVFALPQTLRERFDIVGFDPRGTGRTIPVKCRRNLDSVFALDLTPESVDERATLDEGMAKLARDCEGRNRRTLPYISSQSTVRDMDEIRKALGDEKLNYLGFSYGTYLGALYADSFPDRVRAFVLDGAVDPELGKLELNLQQAQGFEASLDAFFDWCASDRSCELGDGRDPSRAYDRLAAEIDAEPLKVGSRHLGPGEFDLAVVSTLYSGEFAYETLADALGDAANGDGDALLAEADAYSGRRENGTYSNEQEAFWAIGCLDGPRLGGPEAYAAAEPQVRAAAPRLGVSNLNYDLVCAYWPVAAVTPPGPLDARGAPPILVLGTTGDPATPLQWSQALAADLSSGVLLEAEGTTHTSFLEFNECVDDAVGRYLVRLAVPKAGSSCDTG